MNSHKLNKLHISTSHRQIMNALAINFDSDMYNWKRLLQCKLDQVCIIQCGTILRWYYRNHVIAKALVNILARKSK